MEDSCRNLILEYLLHNCYGNTAKAFISDMRNLDMLYMSTSILDKNGNVIHSGLNNNTSGTHDVDGNMHDRIPIRDMEWLPSSNRDDIRERSDHFSHLNGINNVHNQDQWSQLEARRELYYAIQNGKIAKAFDLLSEHFPMLTSSTNATNRTVQFRLNCQRFIEIVRLGETLEALKFAQTTLRALSNDLKINGTPEEIETLSTISSLIAYQNPEQSPIAKYLDQSYRDESADIVNNAVLELVDLPVETRLERIVKQMTVVRSEISALSSKDETSTPYDDIGNILQL
ncbi:CTLH/CRA C-terminal to lish motif domain-containing protein [Umbelopsis sp. PMI_123]|nr:CTLH/CRA C-terminal to lish motif domain-containing protein [Umbelopsis sp. PMI_123]